MKSICPGCEKETHIETITKPECITVRGEAIEVASEYSKCSECGVEFENEERLSAYPPNEFSGYLKFDLRKFLNAALFFCKGGQLKTRLNKLLFYAVFKHFKENAVAITGARYVHLPLGPVPDNYEYFFPL
jgi:Antitoxin SocA-like, Panacea domain